MNQFARAARQKKAHAIASYLDARFATRSSPLVVARWLQSLSESDWRALSVIAGQRPASEQTRVAVRAIYLARAAIEAVRSEAS